MGAVAKLPVYLVVGGGEGVKVGELTITATATGQFVLTAEGIAEMLRAAASEYDRLATQDDAAEGVPDAAAQQ